MFKNTFHKESAATLIVIASLVAIGPLSTDMYLPALPLMKESLSSTVDEMQLTLSIFLIGFAIAQLFCGPLADRFGRKPVIGGGILLFLVASVGCSYAGSVAELLLFRLLQAVGACTGPVLGRAMIRDIYGPERAAKIYSYLASIMALAPAVAPIIGGWIAKYWGWRSVFLALAVFGLVGLLFFIVKVEESLKKELRQPIQVKPIVVNFRSLFRDRTYLAYVLCLSCTYAGLFAFLSGSPFVLIEFMQVSEEHFGLYFLFIVIGYISGSMTSARLGQRYSQISLLRVGVVVTMLSGGVSMALAGFQVYHVLAVILPMTSYTFGVGLVMPQSMAGALRNYPHMAGTASSLLGFAQMGIAAVVGVAVGHLHDGTSWIMSLFIAIMGGAAMLSFLFLLPRSEKVPA